MERKEESLLETARRLEEMHKKMMDQFGQNTTDNAGIEQFRIWLDENFPKGSFDDPIENAIEIMIYQRKEIDRLLEQSDEKVKP